MSQRTMPECAAGLTNADLSAWRDAALSANEAARIDAHRASCPACQARLQGFEMIAASLHAQQVPVPDERLWQSVLAAISASQPAIGASNTHERTVSDASGASGVTNPTPQAPMPLHAQRRRLLGTLAAVAAIALVVIGFGQLFHIGAGNRQEQSFQVRWRQVTLPGNLGAHPDAGVGLSVFPADGSIAWACVPDQSGTKPPALYRTSDGGISWQGIAPPDVKPVYACSIQPDMLDSNVAVLTLNASKDASTPSMHYQATYNGGASWQDVPPFQLIKEFATLRGATYALRQVQADTTSLELVVSKDGMHTWQAIDAPLKSAGVYAVQFWINPQSGNLLVLAAHRPPSYSLWTANASGGDWKQVIAPLSGAVVARPTVDGLHWNICSYVVGTATDSQRVDNSSHIYCATEQSNTWSELPSLDFPLWPGGTTPTSCGNSSNGCATLASGYPHGAITLLGIANDGALLATAEDRFGAKGATTRISLYRLPAGASVWQNGGALPAATALYMPRPGDGMLWSFAVSSSEPMFTANYPGAGISPTPTQAQQTATPASAIDQGSPLAWLPISQPNGLQPQFTDTNILAVAPSNGLTAYACSQHSLTRPPGQWQGWVTLDGGATWSSLALPPGAGWCTLVVDETNPRDVLLGYSQNPPPSLPSMYERSTDGGATWRQIRSLDESVIYQFATQGSSIYALRDATPGATNPMAHLQVSTDGMATWTDIESDIRNARSSVAQFWLNPYNGELLATNAPPPIPATALSSGVSADVWRSNDGGAHWNSLQTPQFGLTTVFAQPPQANHVWGVCVANFAARPGSTASRTLYCGDDSGQTWRDMPALTLDNSSSTPIYTVFTSDGAILALNRTATSNGSTTYTVFRLPSGVSRWQALGPTPEFSLYYAPASGGDGMLWSAPVSGIITDVEGRVFRVAAP